MNIDTEKLEWKARSAIEKILEIQSEAAAEVAKYKALAEKGWKLLDYKPYNYYTHEFNWTEKGAGLYGTDKHVKKTLGAIYWSDKTAFNDTVEKIKELKAADEKTFKENEEIAKNNLGVYNNLINLIKELGIEMRHRDPKSRKRYPDMVDKDFVAELRSGCKAYVGVNPSWNWDQFIEKVEKCLEKDRAEKVKVEQTRIAKEKEQKRDKLIVDLIKKYNLEFNVAIPPVSDVIDALLEKDKYLHLAHYLQENRNDWTSGYDYAETGLNGFKVETETDKRIYKEISGLIGENWDGDGRVFRDCGYSYSVLYGMADNDLLEDYNKLIEYKPY